ncbi:MAG: AraC family transcriptional regulator [Bacteroidales bacterium]|nr:AraC family transcriptional regulator [Bacteroidales bacterium]
MEPQNISISKILQLTSEGVDISALGDDFIIGEAQGTSALSDNRILDILHYPIRFDGYILFFLKKGHFHIDFNLKTYYVHEGSLLVTVPGNIIRVGQLAEDRLAGIELVYVVLSKQFISGLQLDFNKVFQDSVQMLENPCIALNEEQLALAESYFLLARQVVQSSLSNKRNIIGGLLSSLSYMTEDIWTGKLVERQPLADGSARTALTYDRFMKLVTEYHNQERGMQFYADKLCLTPKYLSKIVKEASGRSGPEWIDAFVILEAKNLLRYSDESIKEIAYKLNFPSASVFNKFFKANTGIVPSDYRRRE